jgi:cytochrome P450/NADPH-cytochrome P450 reductase
MSCPFAPPNGTTKPAEQNGTKEPAPQGPEVPIPHPPESWLVGNLREIDPAFGVSSFWRLAEIYGPIYSLSLPGRKVVVLSNFELVNEVCDDARFEKLITGGLESARVLVKNGRRLPNRSAATQPKLNCSTC